VCEGRARQNDGVFFFSFCKKVTEPIDKLQDFLWSVGHTSYEREGRQLSRSETTRSSSPTSLWTVGMALERSYFGHFAGSTTAFIFAALETVANRMPVQAKIGENFARVVKIVGGRGRAGRMRPQCADGEISFLAIAQGALFGIGVGAACENVCLRRKEFPGECPEDEASALIPTES